MKIKNIYISLERNEGATTIKIKAPKELEKFFEKISNGKTQVSEYWKNENGEGQKFYVMSDEYKEMIRQTLKNENYTDNYGNGLISGANYDRAFNISPIRTKGLSSGFVILKSEKFENISNLELEEYVRVLGRLTKKIWEQLINKTIIKSKITFEI